MIRYACLAVALLACGRDPAIVHEWLALWERARDCMLSQPEYGSDSVTTYQVSQLIKDTRCYEARRGLLSLTDEQRESIPGWDAMRMELESLTSSVSSGEMIDRIDEH